MPNPDINVNYVADLARLELSADESERLSSQLGEILQYVAKLEALDVNSGRSRQQWAVTSTVGGHVSSGWLRQQWAVTSAVGGHVRKL